MEPSAWFRLDRGWWCVGCSGNCYNRAMSCSFPKFLEWLLPRVCLICGKENRVQMCPSCRGKIVRMPTHCLRCFRTLPESGQVCAKCLVHPPAVDALAAACLYNEGAREVVLAAKFAARREALAWMGEQMAARVPLEWRTEAIVPIPMSRVRLRRRGFNQTHFLAVELARHLDVALLKRTLTKAERPPQSRQGSIDARRHTIRGAFAAVAPVRVRRVLLVDDVATSGATLREAAGALKSAGVHWVGAVVFAAVAPRS